MGQTTTAELLKKLQEVGTDPQSTVTAAIAAPPTTAELLKKWTEPPTPAAITAPPTPPTAPKTVTPPVPKKSAKQQQAEWDAHKGWPELLALSFNKGLTSPISSLFTSDLKGKQDRALGTAKFNLVQKSSWSPADMLRNAMRFAGMAAPGTNLQGVMEAAASKITQPGVVDTASTVSEMGGVAAGSLPYQAASMEFAGLRKVVDLNKGINLSEKVIRNIYADGMAGASMAAFAKLEPGESRAALIGRNTVISGATSLLAAPLFFRSWKEELGVEASRQITLHVQHRLGISEEAAAAKITALRAGASEDLRVAEEVIKVAARETSVGPAAQEAAARKAAETNTRVGMGSVFPEPKAPVTTASAPLMPGGPTLAASDSLRTAETVVQVVQANPTLAHSPLLGQAQKRLEVTFGHLLPRTPPSIDAGLRYTDPNFGIQLNVYLNGKPTPIKISSKKDDLKAFSRGVNKLRERLVELSEGGVQIKLDDFQMHSQGTWTRFRNLMLGEDTPHTVIEAKELPGAAPKGTVAEVGVDPSVGDRVRVEGDVHGQTREGTVVQRQETPITEAAAASRASSVGTEAKGSSSTETAGTTASVPFMITKVMRAKLKAKGVTEEAIDAMTPAEAHAALQAEVSPASTETRVPGAEERPATPPRRTPTSELSEEELDAKYRSSFTVPMENAVGAVEHVPKDRLKYVVQVGKPVQPMRLAAQPDGDARRFLVNVDQSDMVVEAHGAPSENNYFRSGYFEEVDPQADFGHDPRGYIHSDGSITLSIPQVQRYSTESFSGQRLEGGPQDTASARLHSKQGDAIKLVEQEQPVLESDYTMVPPARPGSITQYERTTSRENMTTRHSSAGYPGGNDKPTNTTMVSGKGKLVKKVVTKEDGTQVGLDREGKEVWSVQTVTDQPSRTTRNKWTGEVTGGEEVSATHTTATGQKVVHEYVHPLSFGAGYIPRKMRDTQYGLPKHAGSREQVASPIRLVPRATAREVKNIQLFNRGAGGEVTAQARGTGAGLTHVDTPQYRVPASTKKNPAPVKPRELYLPKGEVQDVPEMITARDSARIMLKRGIDPETPVRIRASEFAHSSNELIPAEWTLRELAQFEPHMVPLDALRSEASRRGFTFIPQGKGGILRDTETGAEKFFEYQLEAAEHLGRIRESNVGTIIEDPIEQTWKMGWYRSFDAEVDTSRFLGVDAQDLAMKELFTGKRPLVHVWTSDPTALKDTVRQIEQAQGLKPDTLHVMELDPKQVGFGAGRSMPYAIYDPAAVARVAGTVKPGLDAFNIKYNSPAELVSKLQGIPHGLDVLKGRDAESALVYSFLRSNRMKDEWQMGQLGEDSMGKFWTYDPEMKRALFSKIQGASKDIDPSDHSLDEYIKWDPEVEFSPHSITEPSMAEPLDDVGARLSEDIPHPADPAAPVPPAGTGGPRGGGGGGETPAGADSRSTAPFPASTIPGWHWARVPTELYKQIEAQTGVPFWTAWKVLQDARADVEAVLASPYKLLNGWKTNYDKSIREQAQLIFESRMAGRPIDDLVAGSHASAPQAADQLEQAWRTFLGESGFSDHDMREFFAEFPKLRKMGGDFKTYQQSRSGLPKMMKMLDQSLMGGDIRITDRELDGFTLARRIMRMVAQEKHMMPKWNLVTDQMAAFAKSDRSVPPDLFGHFKVHMNNMRHTPDDVAVAITRSVEKSLNKLGIHQLDKEHIGDFMSFILGLNYNANMAWRPGLVLRNMMQTIQTTYPIAGEKYTGKALKYGIKWLRDPALQEEMIHRGIIPRDALSQNFGDIQDLILNAEAGGKGSWLAKGAVGFLRKGTAWYKTTDDFNRVVAYQAQYMRAMHEGRKLANGTITKERFNITSKLDLQDAKDGPLTQLVHRLIDRGDVESAAHAIADNFQGMTQFRYDRANAPRILASTPGRIFGQYGTWSANYLEYARSVTTRGSWENRSKSVARWVAANAAVYYGAQEVFGVDAARWVGFSPLAYAGGPALSIAQQVASTGQMALQGQIDYGKTWDNMSITGTGDADLISKAQAGKLKNVWKQFTPGFGAGRDLYNASKEEEFGEALKRFLAMPSSKPRGSSQPDTVFK